MKRNEKKKCKKIYASKISGRGRDSALFEVVCPAVYIIRVFGLAPYNFPSDNNPPKLRPSKFNTIYTFIWVSFHSYYVFTTLVRFSQLDDAKTIGRFTEGAKLALNYLVSMVDLGMGMVNCEKFVHIWNSILRLDELLELDEFERMPHSQLKFRLWLFIALGTLGWTTVNQFGMFAFKEPYLRNMGYMLGYVGTFVSVFKFCGLVFVINQRFTYLSYLIGNEMKSFGGSAVYYAIKKIESLFNNLLDTTQKLIDLYSWLLLLFLLNLSSHSVSNVYYCINKTILDYNRLSINEVFCQIIWLIMFLLQLLTILITCHFSVYEANKAARNIFEWRRQINRNNSSDTFGPTTRFLVHKLEFSAAGFTIVNLATLTSIFGKITTYLAILLQLSK